MKWVPVLECGVDDDDKPLCYSAIVFPLLHGSDRFIWIERTSEGWNVLQHRSGAFIVLCECASLSSAKRWVSKSF